MTIHDDQLDAPQRPAPPRRRVGAISGGLAVLMLMAWVWVLWVLGAIAYSYGLHVIDWATTR